MKDEQVQELVDRVRAGDKAAEIELVTLFEDEVRRHVRQHLPGKIRTRYDSVDIAQDVWKSVFARGLRGDIVFHNRTQLSAYLGGMVYNKVLLAYRKSTQTKKYDVSREVSIYDDQAGNEVVKDLPSPGATPSQYMQADDYFNKLIMGLNEQQIRILYLRRNGMKNDEIAKSVRVNERTIRKFLKSLGGFDD
jgi:DNA-directed RNA polymerase specialized sigma24 family protein